GPWQPGGPQGPDAPRADTARDGRRRRPTWAALVGTAAGAALLASFGTAGLTGSLDGNTGGSPTATTQSENRENSAPVVTSTTKNPDWANVANAVRPTVVAITVQTGQGTAQGSGVIIDAQGHIVTNHHVVGDAAGGGIQVTLSDGRIYQASVEGTDPATDLAVITLKDPPKDLHAATLGNSDDVVVGDPVAAVGNPLGLSSTVTTGIVSALDRPVQTSEQTQGQGQQGVQVVTNAIQVDAAINPGNSGGPLFDATGRVIGINSSIASIPNASGQAGSIGLGFAIPSNLVKQISDQLIKDGVAQHAFLGVTMKDGTASDGGATRTGAEVQAVQPGTPAADAGLQPGDVIVAINGDPVDGALSLTGFVRQYASGDKVTLTVIRDGKSLELPATLVAKEDQKI
ncbi:S1C family serine protease, partial [Georgenia thermotolerans]